MHIATMCHASFLFNDRPTAHWLGPETLMSLKVEGYEVNALADSGSQVCASTRVPHPASRRPHGLPPKLNRVRRHEDKAPWLCNLLSPGQ